MCEFACVERELFLIRFHTVIFKENGSSILSSECALDLPLLNPGIKLSGGLPFFVTFVALNC